MPDHDDHDIAACRFGDFISRVLAVSGSPALKDVDGIACELIVISGDVEPLPNPVFWPKIRGSTEIWHFVYGKDCVNNPRLPILLVWSDVINIFWFIYHLMELTFYVLSTVISLFRGQILCAHQLHVAACIFMLCVHTCMRHTGPCFISLESVSFP